MAWTMLRVLLVFFASFSQLFGFRRVEAGPCMADWTPFQGSCYFFSTETATWNSARESCQGSGGDLITVSSDSENAFAISHASSLQCLSEKTWLGLRRDPRNTSRWIWPDKNNTELNYTKWHRKQSLRPSPEKNCSEIRPTISIFWYGRECTAQGCYICETDANECSVENVCSGQQCLNVPGGYTCVCGEGFLETMDKKGCKDKDECELDNGGCPHTCINTQGSYVCQCRDGYITERNGTVCRSTLVEYTSASKRNSATESYNRTTAINAVTRPSETETSQENEEQQSGSDNGIEKPQESPSASFGVLLTMAIPLCFIVCFLILCYLKGPGKDKNKELGSTGRLVQSAAPFADTAFMDPVNSRAGKKCRNMKETKNGRHPEEEPMV